MGFTQERMPLVPSEKESTIATTASRALAAYVSTQQELTIELDDGKQKPIHAVLPVSAVRILQCILTEMAQGHAVTVIPLNAELTTQEAAEFLNVSRPFIIKQLEEGQIKFRKVGTHRRIGVQDLVKYKSEIDTKRSASLDELAKEAQRLKLGY